MTTHAFLHHICSHYKESNNIRPIQHPTNTKSTTDREREGGGGNRKREGKREWWIEQMEEAMRRTERN